MRWRKQRHIVHVKTNSLLSSILPQVRRFLVQILLVHAVLPSKLLSKMHSVSSFPSQYIFLVLDMILTSFLNHVSLQLPTVFVDFILYFAFKLPKHIWALVYQWTTFLWAFWAPDWRMRNSKLYSGSFDEGLSILVFCVTRLSIYMNYPAYRASWWLRQ